MKRIISLAALLCTMGMWFILISGIDVSANSFRTGTTPTGNEIPDGPGPVVRGFKPIEHDDIIGTTWVVYQYQGSDGKVQDMDTEDPVKKITFAFDNDSITIQWGNQTTKVGTYEWYIEDQSLDNIIVHFKHLI